MDKKTAKVNDSVELWTRFLEYILERAKKRYNTVEEMTDDVNKMFKSGMEVIQQNYDRWFTHELKPNMASYGIELLGSDDIVMEGDTDIVDEDPFMTDDEAQAPEGIDENNFFDDEGAPEEGDIPMKEGGEGESQAKQPFLDNSTQL